MNVLEDRPRASALRATLLLISFCLAGAAAAWGGFRKPEPRDRELIEREKAFAGMAADKGIHEAFLHFSAPDCVYFDVDPQKAVGAAALEHRKARWSSVRALKWEPLGAQIAASGDLGYTWGTSEMHVATPEGGIRVIHGHYVSIWRRDADRQWKLVLDTGNPLPEKNQP